MNISKLKYIIIGLTTLIAMQSSAQIASPYQTDFKKDGIWVAGGLGLSALGLYLVAEKDELDASELPKLDKDDIWVVDRWAAGNSDESASKISDIPFYTSFAIPFIYAFNKDTKHLSGQLGVMYLESLSTTAALYAITAGLVNKSRPLVYNENVALDERLESSGQRSFYSGHVAASATATFFAAQVFSDLYPNSKAKPYVWAGAALIPAVVGHYRIEAGKHFLSDVLLGYALGAASGILVPRIHRKKRENLKIGAGVGFNGTHTININYVF